MKSTHTSQYHDAIATLIATRKERGVTQVKLAEALGKPQSFVAKFEGRERRLDIVEFLAICQALGADPLLLLQKAGLIRQTEK